MKRILLGLVILITGSMLHAQMTVGPTISTASGPVPFMYYTPGNYRATGTGHPMIISLGGVGEQGDGTPTGLQNLYIGGIPKKIHDGSNMVFSYTDGANVTTTDGFVVLAPQIPQGAGWQNYFVDAVITYGKAHFNIDPNRIFLTGYSLGGEGTWNYVSNSANAGQLAGIIPISTNYGVNYCNVAGNKIAVWAFQGAQDNIYGGSAQHSIINNINACANLIIPAYDSIYADYIHGADFWDNNVYSLTNNFQYPNAFQWMLKINKSTNVNTDAAPVPVISNGNVVNLTTPINIRNFPVLDGSKSTDDDIIVSYKWQEASVPSGTNVSVVTPQRPVATVSLGNGVFLVPTGTYTFRFGVKDYLTSATYSGHTHTQTATKTINVSYPASGFSAPATDAGGTITIPVTQSSVTRWSGNAAAYPCAQCNVTGYNWQYVSGPPNNHATLSSFDGTQTYGTGDNNVSFTNLDQSGAYVFQFSAKNAHGDIGTDNLTIIKQGTLLPVNYAYFNGQGVGNKNVLSWATTQEVNSERFDITRSTDGVNFSIIGSLASKGGAVLTNYGFDDNNPPLGLAYYRLSQVDKDGHSALSATVSVTNRKTGLYIEKYPNPVHDNLTVTLQSTGNGTAKVVVADMQGKAILQQVWQKDLPLLKKTINVGALQNGVYQLIITVGEEKQVSSFVKY